MSGVRQVYSRGAAEYDTRWARYLEATLSRTVRSVPANTAGPLLDVACGTGLLLERLLQRHPRIDLAGVDLSPEMMERARARLGEQARLVIADVARLPFANEAFTIVTSSSALHHWPDPTSGLTEIARVLRPGGMLILTDWRADHLPTRARDLALRVTDPSHRRALTVGETRRLLANAGFGVRRIDRYSVGWSWGLMTISATAAGG